MLHRNFSNIDQTGFARYEELLKVPGSNQVTYGHQPSYSQSDQILQTAVNKIGFVIFDELLKFIRQFSLFSTRRTIFASAAEFTVLFCEKRDVNVSYDTSQAFDTYRVYNQSPVIVKRSSIYKRYHLPHIRHLPLIAASREKNRAMWRTTVTVQQYMGTSDEEQA